MPKRFYTDQEKATIVKLWREQRTAAEIATVIETTPGAVKTLVSKMRKHGVDLPYGRSGRDQVSKDELRQRLAAAKASGERSGRGNKLNVHILELRLAGHTPTKIAKMLDLSVYTVKNSIRDCDHQKLLQAAATRTGRCIDCGAPTRRLTSKANPDKPHGHETVFAPALRCDRHAREARWGHPQWTRESVIVALQKLHAELGRVPHVNDVRGRSGYPSWPTVKALFGSWGAALIAAGMEPYPSHRTPRWTHERLIAGVCQLAQQLGYTPTIEEAKASGLVGVEAARKLFGGWPNFIKEAGLPPRRRSGRKPTEHTASTGAQVLKLGGALAYDGETVEAAESLKDLAA